MESVITIALLEVEVLEEAAHKNQKSQTKSTRRRASSSNEKLLQEDSENSKKTKSDESKSDGEYIQVKSSSGKTMMVERSRLAALMARQGTSVNRVRARVPQEILLTEEEEEEEPRVAKRLQEGRGGPSKRPRRHLG